LLLGQLRLTTTHYVFNEKLSIIFARDLHPRETKILVLDDNNKLVPVLVDNITNVSQIFLLTFKIFQIIFSEIFELFETGIA
jgi:hypothetical protein